MIAGLDFQTARYRIKVGYTASGSFSGSGSGNWAAQASLSSASIFNVVSLNPGIDMGVSGSSLTGESNWGVSIYEVGNASGPAGDWDSAALWLDLIDLSLFGLNTPNWYLTFGGVEILVNGELATGFDGGELSGTGFAPGYVPLFGVPFLFQAAPQASGGPSNPVSAYDYTTRCEMTATAGYEWLDEDGEWVSPALELIDPVSPGGPSLAGIAGGSSCAEATLSLYTQHRGHQIAAAGDYYVQSTDEETTGRLWLVPSSPRGVVRMDEGDYGALVMRGGFPATRAKATRYYGPTEPPVGPGPPPPRPYFKSEETFPDVHPSVPFYDPAIVEEATHAIESPMSTPIYAPVYVSSSDSTSSWVALGIASGAGGDPPVFDAGQEADTATYTFPIGVQMPNRALASPPMARNLGMLPYLGWDDGTDPQSDELKVLLYASYRAAPHWSYFLPILGDLWDVGGSPPGEERWLASRQQVLGSPGGRRNHVLAEPLDQGGDVGFVEAVTGRKGWWWGGRFDLRPTVRPSEMQIVSPGLYHGDGDDPDPAVTGTTVELAAGRTAWEVETASWTVAPYMYGRTCDRVRISLPAGHNVAELRVYAVAADDLTPSPPGPSRTEFPDFVIGAANRIPRGPGRAWWTTAGLAHGEETYVRIAPAKADASAFFAGDPAKEQSPPLAPVGMGERLRIEVVPLDPNLPTKVSCPVLVGAPLGDARLLAETGRFGAVLAKDGPSFRFGSGLHFDFDFDVPIASPIPRSSDDRMPLLGDGIAWVRAYLEARDPIGDLDDEISALYVPNVEYVVSDALWRDPEGFLVTHSFLAPGKAFQPVPVFVQSYRATPPTWQFPERKRLRSADWEAEGDLGLWTYSHCPTRMVLHAPKQEPEDPRPRLLVGGVDVLSDHPAARVPSGWGVGSHERPASDTVLEDATISIWSDGTYRDLATVRPWRGYGAVWGALPDASKGFVALSVSLNYVHALGFPSEDGTLTVARANNATPTDFADEYPTALAPDSLDMAHPKGRASELWYAASVDGSCLLLRGALGQEPQMVSTVGPGAWSTLDWSHNNVCHHYRLSEGAVYLRRFDLLGNAMGPEEATNLTSIDDAQIVARCSVSDGKLVVTLACSVLGGRVVYRSEGGVTFS